MSPKFLREVRKMAVDFDVLQQALRKYEKRGGIYRIEVNSAQAQVVVHWYGEGKLDADLKKKLEATASQVKVLWRKKPPLKGGTG
jgi:hypothetical protein